MPEIIFLENYEVYFWHADKHQRLLQADTIIWVCITRHAQIQDARHAQITQNDKFAIFLQYFKKEVSEVYFLHADKYESLLQIDTMIQVEW